MSVSDRERGFLIYPSNVTFVAHRDWFAVCKLDRPAAAEFERCWREFWMLAGEIHDSRPCPSPFCCPGGLWIFKGRFR